MWQLTLMLCFTTGYRALFCTKIPMREFSPVIFALLREDLHTTKKKTLNIKSRATCWDAWESMYLVIFNIYSLPGLRVCGGGEKLHQRGQDSAQLSQRGHHPAAARGWVGSWWESKKFLCFLHLWALFCVVGPCCSAPNMMCISLAQANITAA